MLPIKFQRFHHVSETANNMLSSLSHCVTLFRQQEEVRMLQLRQEKEKCRVLEEALNVLAKQHHDLEQSVATHLSRVDKTRTKSRSRHSFFDASDDEFYDAFEAGMYCFIIKLCVTTYFIIILLGIRKR